MPAEVHAVDAADDCVQEALVEALTAWRAGLRDNPVGWLHTVARNRAVDRLRRAASAERRTLGAGHELQLRSVNGGGEQEGGLVVDDGTVPDEHLRLMLLCCHPALDRDAQVRPTRSCTP